MESEDLKRTAQAVEDLRISIEHTHGLSLRVGARTTQIIRMGFLSVIIVCMAMFYLVYVLGNDFGKITENMVAMSENMKNMDQHFQKVSQRMESMDTTLKNMEKHVAYMPNMSHTMTNLNGNTNHMATDMSLLRNDLTHITEEMKNMSNQVGHMNSGIHSISRSVNQMTGSVETMSRPMDFFPFK